MSENAGDRQTCVLCGRDLPIAAFPPSALPGKRHQEECVDCWTAYGYPDIATQLRTERKQVERVQHRATLAAGTRYVERAELVSMIRGMVTRMRSAGLPDREIARRTGVSTTALRGYCSGAVPLIVHAEVFERISEAYVAFVATQPAPNRTLEEVAEPDRPEQEPSGRGVTKLTTDEVIAIRARFAAGETTGALGDEYGVDRNTIRAIGKYQTWKHVLPDGSVLPPSKQVAGRLPFRGELGDPVPAIPAEKRHHNAKLTPRQESAIREEWALGARTALIAERYGVSEGTVRKVCRSDDPAPDQVTNVSVAAPHPWMQDDADRYAQIAARKGRRRTPELPSTEATAPAPVPDHPLGLRERLAARRQRDRQDGHT
ncbi:MAG: hypothetical protein H0T72_01530 [Chloroflexia bacterium]|nr:hypothetical protein [Chloroflexia bacterium]